MVYMGPLPGHIGDIATEIMVSEQVEQGSERVNVEARDNLSLKKGDFRGVHATQ
jgi:hypothetical protein